MLWAKMPLRAGMLQELQSSIGDCNFRNGPPLTQVTTLLQKSPVVTIPSEQEYSKNVEV